jgi:hypothetical protein
LEFAGDFMKTNHLKKLLPVMVVAGLALTAATVLAQDSSATNAAPLPPAATAPPLAHGVPQILQLAQANLNDATIIAYIKNSGNSYNLNAEQIIYLKQQGVSSAIITTMLNQPRPAMIVDSPATPVPTPAASTTSEEPVADATAETAPVVNPEPAALVAAEPDAGVNYEPVADANAEPAFTVYSDPLAAGAAGPAVSVIYYQTAPAATFYYQPQYAPAFGGYPVRFSGSWGGGWHGGFHRGWHR